MQLPIGTTLMWHQNDDHIYTVIKNNSRGVEISWTHKMSGMLMTYEYSTLSMEELLARGVFKIFNKEPERDEEPLTRLELIFGSK